MGNCLAASRSPSSRDEAKRAAPLESTPKPTPTPTPSITPASSVLERIYSSFNRRLTAKVEVEPPAASGSSWLDVRDVKGLDFCSPALLRPHGLAGVLSISIGLVFTVRSVLGMNHGAPASVVAPYVALYVVSSLVSAAGALGLIKKAPSSTRVFFKALAMLQIGLLYFTYRFATFPELLGLPPAMRAIADVAMASLAVASLLMQIYGVYTNTSDTPRGLRVATFVALAAISALAGYPGQLALFGESWLRKVCQWYPMQLNAFTFYVFIPATFGLNVIAFSATLHLRRLISTRAFVAIILGFVFGTLIPTVLSQEFHIPYVSTQKLLIFSRPAWGCQRWC